MKRLSDRFCYGVKPTGKRQTFNEGDGFVFRVEPSGKKYFYYRFYDGKQREKKIGQFDSVSLKEARRIHADMINQRERGTLLQEVITFEGLFKKFLKAKRSEYKDGGTEVVRIMEKDVLHFIGKKDIKEIRKADIFPILEEIVDRGSPRQANITLDKISTVLRYGCAIGLLENNACYMMPKATENGPRDRVLSEEEIKIFFTALEQSKISYQVKSSLLLQLYTGQRPGECLRIKKTELNSNWWTISKERSKNGLAHRVYLSESARPLATLIANLDRDMPTQSARRATERLIKRLTYKDGKEMQPFSPHDLRRTVATMLANLGFIDQHINRLLNHKQDIITATYNRYQYDAEKKEMLLTLEKKINSLLKE